MSVTWPIIINGAAVSLLFMPLTVTATATLRNEELGNATGIYNLMRNIGGSLGISMMITMLSRTSQSSQSVLAAHVSSSSPVAQDRLRTLTETFSRSMDPASASQHAHAVLYGLVQQQASMQSYIYSFRFMGWLCLAAIPLAFLFKRADTSKKSAGAAVH
jgi:DHA2 family multidrug resistance protein